MFTFVLAIDTGALVMIFTFQPLTCNAETNTRREISMRVFPRWELITRISVLISTNTGFHSQGYRRPSVHPVKELEK